MERCGSWDSLGILLVDGWKRLEPNCGPSSDSEFMLGVNCSKIMLYGWTHVERMVG